jgi:hypothetical protein
MELVLLGIACFLMGGISFTFYLHRCFILYCQYQENKKYCCGAKADRRHHERRSFADFQSLDE